MLAMAAQAHPQDPDVQQRLAQAGDSCWACVRDPACAALALPLCLRLEKGIKWACPCLGLHRWFPHASWSLTTWWTSTRQHTTAACTSICSQVRAWHDEWQLHSACSGAVTPFSVAWLRPCTQASLQARAETIGWTA